MPEVLVKKGKKKVKKKFSYTERGKAAAKKARKKRK